MLTVSVVDLLWLVLAGCLLSSGMTILSAAVTGWLVFRTRKEAHERLFPAKRVQRKGPVNIDEFAAPEEEDVMPSALSIQNKVFGAQFGVSELKGEKNG
jgi:hypothetical protein